MTTAFQMIAAALLLALAGCSERADIQLGERAAHAQEEEELQTPSLACFRAADDLTWLSDSQKLSLCQGALSIAPAVCHAAAEDELMLSEQQAIDLCRCAESTAPVACAIEADGTTDLSDQQILELCAPIVALGVESGCLSSGQRAAPSGGGGY